MIEETRKDINFEHEYSRIQEDLKMLADEMEQHLGNVFKGKGIVTSDDLIDVSKTLSSLVDKILHYYLAAPLANKNAKETKSEKTIEDFKKDIIKFLLVNDRDLIYLENDQEDRNIFDTYWDRKFVDNNCVYCDATMPSGKTQCARITKVVVDKENNDLKITARGINCPILSDEVQLDLEGWGNLYSEIKHRIAIFNEKSSD